LKKEKKVFREFI